MTTKIAAPAVLSIGAIIDRLKKMQDKRIESQRCVDEMKKDEKAVEQQVIEMLTAQKLDGAKGKLATAAIVNSVTPIIEDWDKFIAFVAKTKDWSLIQKRAGTTAIVERWDNKQEIPGIGRLPKQSLSLTKR